MEFTKCVRPVLRLPFRYQSSNSGATQFSALFARCQSSQTPSPASSTGMRGLLSSIRSDPARSRFGDAQATSLDAKNAISTKYEIEPQPWHLHVYSTKHNTHLTLSRPNRKSVISISSGNIGFRKAARGSYDAGYQLGAYMMARINRAGLLQEIKDLEVIFRGFGNGREAVGKILLGTEGGALRAKVTKVSDATRLKFGGTRSPRPRRLG